MFKVTYDLSKGKKLRKFTKQKNASIHFVLESHPNYHLYEDLLSDGWLFGRKVDNSDAQYGQFRDNIPKLLPLVLLHLALNKANRSFHWIQSNLHFSLITSLLTVFLFHGSSTFKIIFIITASFSIGHYCKGSKWNPILTWCFNLLVLFINEYYDGYQFTRMFGQGFQWLDNWEGFQARWHILFNFAMLRLVSFNMDYYWACASKDTNIKGHPAHEAPRTDKERINNPLIKNDYNYINFLAYVLYTPLLLCGPIITFNDFISQVNEL
jgi:D-alanyl-lipoteichoic acid acyltransferase DltB (MBOAT superfamily)